jgi:Ca-activated chloride channel family protein
MRKIVMLSMLLFSFACSAPDHPLTLTPAGSTASQSGYGSIDGSVIEQNAPLPGANVSVVAANGQTIRTALSDTGGGFHFLAVPAGSYSLRAELAGMNRIDRRIVVTANQTATTQLAMTLSGVAEAITVTADASAARDTASLSSTYRNAAPIVVPAPPPPPMQAQKVMAGRVVGGAVASTYMPSPLVEPSANAPQYSAIREHDFTIAKNEATTTFSIDVDRASYTNVRRQLAANHMPFPDSVRIEEMVNYFTYRYPQPSGDAPFSITTEVAGCPWAASHRLLRIGIQGRNLEEWKMAANNLVFLIDVSGSMSPPDRLPLIQSAFRLLVDRMRPQDSVAIVVYAGAAGVVLQPTNDKNAILAALSRLQAGGSTAGGAGIELAYRIARENFIKGGNNRVILATDGDFNVGVSSLASLQTLIEEERRSGVSLTTIGVGDDNYRDSVLELLADKGNGNYAYLDGIDEARKVFGQQLTGTLVTIAKDVKVQLEFNPALVAEYRQIGYEDRALANSDFHDDTKDAGELGAGHSVTALYELVPAASSGGNIATVRLRYKAPDGDTSRLLEVTARDRGKSAWDASADMQFAVAVAEFGLLLRQSPHRGTATYAEVLQLARAYRGEDLDGSREELIRLVESSRALGGEAPPVIAER